MSPGKGRSVGADTTGKAVSRTSKLRSTDAGSGVPDGPSRDSGMTESEWAQQVEDLALIGGFRVYRVTNSTREIVRRTTGARIRVRNVNASGVGFPDMVLVNARRRTLLFVELKRGKQKGHHHGITPEQEGWLADLRAVATDADSIGVYVWTPANIDQVTAVLIGKVD